MAVDAVSGASLSSEAMLAAVEDAVTKGGGNLEVLKAGGVQKAGEGKTEKLESDVVVVGAGASGVSAAVTAADKGAKVIIIEKTGVIGEQVIYPGPVSSIILPQLLTIILK